jgi:hypothetical protein
MHDRQKRQEAFSGLVDIPVKQGRQDHRVAQAGYGKQLRDALEDRHHDGLQGGHLISLGIGGAQALPAICHVPPQVTKRRSRRAGNMPRHGRQILPNPSFNPRPPVKLGDARGIPD